MDSYIIQVQPQDELTVIIDKIINTQADRVYLLISEKSRITHHTLNFRLLKREADAMGKEIIVVSESPRVQNLALQAQLQAHQETRELRKRAQRMRPSAHSKPEKLSDIALPSPTSEGAKPPVPRSTTVVRQAKHGSAVSSPASEDQDIGTKEGQGLTSRDSQYGKIASFWGGRGTTIEEDVLGEYQKKHRESPLPRFIQDIGSVVIVPRGDSILSSNIKRPFSLRLPNISINMSAAYSFRVVLVSLITVSVFIAAITLYSILPRAKIHITLFTEKITLESEITGDTSVSQVHPEGFILPAQIFEKSIEKSKTSQTTGEKEVRDKSTGSINVYNSFSSSKQTLVATTRFVSENGKLFRTVQTIVVPGAKVKDGKIVPSYTSVEVVAAEAGAEYNIGPAAFSIPGFKGTPKYTAFYGQSERSMVGGKVGTVKVVTENDYNILRKNLESELELEISRELEILLPEGFIIPEGASQSRDIQITSSASPGDAAEALTVAGSVYIAAFAIRDDDAESLLRNDFSNKFPGKKLLEDGDKVIYKVNRADFGNGILEIDVSLLVTASAIVKTSEIIEAVQGKEERDVRAYLAAHPSIKEAKLIFWPFWVNKMPDEISGIEIIVNE